MIAFAIVLVIIGGILLAISSPRKGGNFEIGTSDIRTNLPEITGPAKIPAFILGLALIGVGLWMGILLFTKSLEEDDKKVTEIAQAEPTAQTISTPREEISTPTSSSTNISVPTSAPSTSSSINPSEPVPQKPLPTVQSPSNSNPSPLPQSNCNQGAFMPPVPQSPPPGCVLTVEWWYPPNPTPCGLWITYASVEFEEGVAGYWWYEYDVTVPAHIKAFKAKDTSAPCEVVDFREK